MAIQIEKGISLPNDYRRRRPYPVKEVEFGGRLFFSAVSYNPTFPRRPASIRPVRRRMYRQPLQPAVMWITHTQNLA